MIRLFILPLLTCFPLLMQAASLPDVVIKNDNHNLQMCIDNAANNCVNTICLNSSDVNCGRE